MGAEAGRRAAPTPAAAAGPTPMRPGLWETSVDVQTAGSDTKRTIVSRTCYADTDVPRPPASCLGNASPA
jgi:hypothetical protein